MKKFKICVLTLCLALSGCGTAQFGTNEIVSMDPRPKRIFVEANFPEGYAPIEPDFEKTFVSDLRSCGVDARVFYHPWKMATLELNQGDKEADLTGQMAQEEDAFAPDMLLKIKFVSATRIGFGGPADFLLSLTTRTNSSLMVWGGQMRLNDWMTGESIANYIFEEMKTKNVLINCH